MSDSYYQKMLNQVHQLMDAKEENQALSLLEEELRMPYIPKVYQEAFELLTHELKAQLKQQQEPTQALYDNEKLLTLFKGSIEHQLKALEVLSRSNLRDYHELIQQVFNQDMDMMIQNLLIQLCIQQQLTHEFHLERDGIDIDFMPASLISPSEDETLIKAKHELQDIFDKEPSLLMMAHDRIDYYGVLILPQAYDADELSHLVHQVVYDVMQAMGLDEAWHAYQERHKVDIQSLALIN